jgi:hypothetical protein
MPMDRRLGRERLASLSSKQSELAGPGFGRIRAEAGVLCLCVIGF